MSGWCIVYLASPKDRRIDKTLGSLRKFDILDASLKIAKRVFPTTDIYIFHEDFTQTEKDALPPVREYIQVDFSGFDDVFVKHVFPKGYVLMCRFFSGVLQAHPCLQQYSHYMRLDDDSYFLDPLISEAHVQTLLKHDYVYRSLFIDLKDHQDLFDYTLRFLESIGSGRYLPQLMQNLRKMRFLDSNGKYTGLAPYNNFHISSLRLWKNPVILEYIYRLEAEQLILKRGWLDANIHAMIIFVLAPFLSMSIQHDGSFGYRHNKHMSAMGSPNIAWVDSLPFHP